MSDAQLPDGTAIGRVALRVNDLDRLAAFYESVVGLEVLARDDDRASLGVDGTALLELVAAPEAPERGRAETGLFHTAFRVPSRAALADALGRIEEHWHLDGASDHRVSEALYLSDPEGNGIEIYRDRPRSAWPTEGGRVQMDTLPLDLDDLREAADGDAGAAADQNAAASPETAPAGTTVGHVHLEVSSLSGARAFYVDALGLALRQAYGASALFVAAGGYHHHVGLNVWNGRTEPPSGRGLAWFEVVVPDETTLAAARKRLEEDGFDPTATPEGVEVADPDGIPVRLRVGDR
ncbi:MAG: VOC family protein [Haloferacaceae archaeon]